MPKADSIVTARPSHLSQGEVYSEVRRVFGADPATRVLGPGEGEISDAAALTIASWWQSPSTGKALAQLASTGRVNATELLADISRVFADDKPTGIDNTAVGCLATWAINHESRERTTLWVCRDCLEAAEFSEHDLGHKPNSDAWKLWASEPGEISIGLLYSEHVCGIDADGLRVWDGSECECETNDYATSPCDGCGSPLAGERHAYTYDGTSEGL